MTEKWDKTFDIHVALKVIRHLSAGIYRTPGGAIKELVSNSFDAQATCTYINVANDFSSVQIRDNGIGMTEEVIERSLSLIGASIKVSEPELYEGNIKRPIIGKFGIGLLASAHISKEIRIYTYPRDENDGILLELDLRPYFEYENQIKTLEEFSFGTAKYKKIEKKGKSGTLLELTNVDKETNFYEFISKPTRRPYIRWPKEPESGGENLIMAEFVKNIGEDGVTSIQNLSGMEQMLWELGIICPVKYLPGGPLYGIQSDRTTSRIIDDNVRRVSELDFTLYFNNVEVRKPIMLPTPKSRYTYIDNLDMQDLPKDVRVFPIDIDKKGPTGKRIRAEGYVMVQPYRVFPQEIRGLYPRLDFVGIGNYDYTVFKIVRGEQPFLRVMLSGELYVLSGLDDALNLDRSGFIELDSDYNILRDELAKKFNEDIIKKAKEVSSRRTQRRKKLKEGYKRQERQNEIERVASQLLPDYAIHFVSKFPSEGRTRTVAYGNLLIDDERKTIYIDEREEDEKLIAVILGADRTLSSIPEGHRLRQELASRVTKILEQYD